MEKRKLHRIKNSTAGCCIIIHINRPIRLLVQKVNKTQLYNCAKIK